jgi:hypothetical protein
MKKLFIKQRFTNYEYVVADNRNYRQGKCDWLEIFIKQNDYSILVYYRENADRYDRVIGKEQLTP